MSSPPLTPIDYPSLRGAATDLYLNEARRQPAEKAARAASESWGLNPPLTAAAFEEANHRRSQALKCLLDCRAQEQLARICMKYKATVEMTLSIVLAHAAEDLTPSALVPSGTHTAKLS